jgi:hypothetical protein
MAQYCLGGQEFNFPVPLPEAAPFEITGNEDETAEKVVSGVPALFLQNQLIAHSEGWVANAERGVEIWSVPSGMLVRTDGGSDFTISQDGREIQRDCQGQGDGELNETDRQILLGPVLALALALRGDRKSVV